MKLEEQKRGREIGWWEGMKATLREGRSDWSWQVTKRDISFYSSLYRPSSFSFSVSLPSPFLYLPVFGSLFILILFFLSLSLFTFLFSSTEHTKWCIFYSSIRSRCFPITAATLFHSQSHHENLPTCISWFSLPLSLSLSLSALSVFFFPDRPCRESYGSSESRSHSYHERDPKIPSSRGGTMD